MNDETVRRLWHSSIGLLIVVLYFLQISIPKFVVYLLLPATIIYGAVDCYRLRHSEVNKRFVTSFPLRYIIRREEYERLTTIFWFLLGALVTLWFFSRPVAALSLLYLAWCDPMAAFIGKKFGPKNKKAKGRFWNGKTFIGTAAAAILGSVITTIFLLCSARPDDGSLLMYAFRVMITSGLGGLYAAAAELVKIGDLDDNLTMPVVAAFLLSLLSPIGALYAHQI
jgi:dolichol kinase